MIEITQGNLLTADAEALVNTVNTAGVMGKGVALQFKQAFPENYKAYRSACRRGEVVLGRVFAFHNGDVEPPHWILNFPTKGHWKSRSRLDDIEEGLRDLVRVLQDLQIASVAVPPLGCGNGGLNWADVRPMIYEALDDVPDLRVLLFEPGVTPAAASMPIRTQRPRMTRVRAAILGLLSRYPSQGFGLSRLETQKLAYLLEACGEPLKLDFTKQQYGPYSEKLQFVLQSLEGHHIHGYGDRTTPSPLTLVPGARAEADVALSSHPETFDRMAAVLELVDGFESPYGLELLSTVHWVATANPEARTAVKAAVREVQAWSGRKKRIFTERHIAIAWEHLNSMNWLVPISAGTDPSPTLF